MGLLSGLLGKASQIEPEETLYINLRLFMLVKPKSIIKNLS